MEEDVYQLKQDLRDLKKYLEEILLFLPLPICSVNPLGIVIDANRAFYDLTGYEKGTVIKGETIFRIDVLFKDKKQWKRLEKRILKKEVIKNEEITLITKNNRQVFISLSASFRENEEGVLGGYFLALHDITEIKSLHESLEKKVKERTKELQERVVELERFHKLTVGRELKMLELKKEIARLKDKKG